VEDDADGDVTNCWLREGGGDFKDCSVRVGDFTEVTVGDFDFKDCSVGVGDFTEVTVGGGDFKDCSVGVGDFTEVTVGGGDIKDCSARVCDFSEFLLRRIPTKTRNDASISAVTQRLECTMFVNPKNSFTIVERLVSAILT